MPSQVHLVLGEADCAYLLAMQELEREGILLDRAEREGIARRREELRAQLHAATKEYGRPEMGTSVGPSGPTSTYRLGGRASRTASVQPNSPGHMDSHSNHSDFSGGGRHSVDRERPSMVRGASPHSDNEDNVAPVGPVTRAKVGPTGRKRTQVQFMMQLQGWVLTARSSIDCHSAVVCRKEVR
jgi:hypothetical protein